MRKPVITVKQLEDNLACRSQIDLFEQIFGSKVQVSVWLAGQQAGRFDWHWAAARLLSQQGKNAWCAKNETIYRERGDKIVAAAERHYAPSYQTRVIRKIDQEYRADQGRAFAELYIEEWNTREVGRTLARRAEVAKAGKKAKPVARKAVKKAKPRKRAA